MKKKQSYSTFKFFCVSEYFQAELSALNITAYPHSYLFALFKEYKCGSRGKSSRSNSNAYI